MFIFVMNRVIFLVAILAHSFYLQRVKPIKEISFNGTKSHIEEGFFVFPVCEWTQVMERKAWKNYRMRFNFRGV